MHFKHPEILWFLFLLAVPIIVHLFQLRRFKKEYFTNVQILKTLVLQTRKSARLKKYLLLFSRLFLLAAAVLAFAQPFFAAKDTKGAANELFIVLDNSCSMQAKGKQGELLRREIENLLAHTPKDLAFSLLTNDQVFWDTDIQSITRDLQQLTYSATPFDMSAQLAKIKTRHPAIGKDIIVITDATGVEKQAPILPNSQAFVIVPEAENKENVAIDSVYLEQTLDQFYEVGFSLSATGQVENLPLALYNRGKLIAKTQTSFKRKTSIKLSIPKEDFHGYATITDQGLPYDNTLYFSLSKPKKVKVLAIGEPSANGFLTKIFGTDEFDYSQTILGNIDYTMLEQQEMVILNEVKDLTANLQNALKNFAQQGGNLVIIPAEEAVIATNSLLAHFGNYAITSTISTKKQVTRIAFQHPLYKDVFEKKIDNFQYPSSTVSFNVRGGLPAALSFEDGNLFLGNIDLTASSVYIFAAPLNLNNSNFQQSPLVVPTFYNMAQHASTSGIVSLILGNDVPFFAETTISKDEILSITADGQQHIPQQQAINNKVKLVFNHVPQNAGNYTLLKGNEPVGYISFNHGRAESLLANPGAYDLYQSAEALPTIFDLLKQTRTGTPLWKWFILLALVFLVTEILIQKFIK